MVKRLLGVGIGRYAHDGRAHDPRNRDPLVFGHSQIRLDVMARHHPNRLSLGADYDDILAQRKERFCRFGNGRHLVNYCHLFLHHVQDFHLRSLPFLDLKTFASSLWGNHQKGIKTNILPPKPMGPWSSGMTSPRQGEGHQFEPGRAQFFLSPSLRLGKEKPGKKKMGAGSLTKSLPFYSHNPQNADNGEKRGIEALSTTILFPSVPWNSGAWVLHHKALPCGVPYRRGACGALLSPLYGGAKTPQDPLEGSDPH